MGQMNKRTGIGATRTHEGARAMTEAPIAALQRVINAHMLWEDSFYVNGTDSAVILIGAVKRAVAHDAAMTAIVIAEARKVHNIRHASLLAAVTYAKVLPGPLAVDLIAAVIQRADELAEVLVMSAAKDTAGVPMKALNIPSAVRKGVKRAFDKFDEYQFGKYQGRDKAISLKGAVFLTHPSPKTQPLVQKIVEGTLAIPATWETGLSGGGDKTKVFTDLLQANKLGAMALLRNLRNMHDAHVDRKLIEDAMERANWSRVLPFRFMSAAQTAPWAAGMLDKAFKRAVGDSVYLKGRTAVLLDTSGSMGQTLSYRGTVRAYQAGAVLAAAINGDHVDLIEWGDRADFVPNWNSLSTAMSIQLGRFGYGTNAGQAIQFANGKDKYDRLIVITDMQFNDGRVPGLAPHQKGYTINVGRYNTAGLMSGKWVHLTGFSNSILKWIGSNESVS